LLERGERSKGWRLEENVRLVREAGDPHAEFIAALAKVVSADADIETLARFPQWQRGRFELEPPPRLGHSGRAVDSWCVASISMAMRGR